MIDQELFQSIHKLLDKESFEEARKVVNEKLKELSKEKTQKSFRSQTELYGFLIDIGFESKNENDLNEAINFFEKNETQLKTSFTKSSFYYNLANAKHGLSEIYFLKNKGVPSLEIIKTILQAPINLYWLAYKNLNAQNNQNLEQQILINLSNSLIDAGRMVEGLQFLDIVLRNNSRFPQALISRGDMLRDLDWKTNCSITISLYTQIYKSYNEGIQTNVLPQSQLQKSIFYRDSALKKIESHGFNIDTVNNEILETEKEYNTHTDFRKFCLNNFITLNEHALYCNCRATIKDDLVIGVKHAKFKGEIVPKLELLLNRIKSEFSLARWLFYQTKANDDKIDFDTRYSELLDGESINPKTEMMRASFRICYGTLDKIALGICKLYNLSKDDETLLFESFWKSKPDRWTKLNQIKNIHLSALYSIASDLNTTNGELKHFKQWRNKLEHKVFVLKDTEKFGIDILKVFQDEDLIAVADINDFENKTLHLLQLTRAAIFSFVFCVRLQTIEKLEEGDESKTFLVDFKKN